jgi:putative aldouronate transport system substrate-binding protein
MVDAHPVNEAGQRVYGISMFSDWGGVSGGPDAINWYGKLQYGFLEIDPVNGTGTSIVDNNSYYKRTMLLLFNANQMGILDPDSITQGYSDMLAKGKAGRVLFSPFSWGTPGQFRTPEREAAGIGYRLVPFKNAKLVRGSDTRADPFGNHIWSWAVGKNTKHLDKALAFINYLYSYDGCWLMQNGRQGVKWDLDENGEPYLTQAGVDIQYNGVPYPNGGTQGNASGIYQGLDVKTIHPVYGRQINTADWVKKDYIPQDSALVLDWRRLMNAQDDVDYYIKNNIYINPPFAPMDPAPDSIALAQNRVNEVVVPLSWQMIYAKDRAEFDRLWAEMTEQARGRGLDTVNDWYRDAYARAKVTGAKYVNIR